MVTQGSEWPKPPHPAKQAIDENSNKYAHTSVEPNAWWSMEFCNDVIIARVRLWNRVDCCNEQMANFVVTVDNEINLWPCIRSYWRRQQHRRDVPKAVNRDSFKNPENRHLFLSISELHMLKKMENMDACCNFTGMVISSI